jgi:glycosyltransferase involved in cell wall biosynthesis
VPLKGYDILIKALSLILPQKKCRMILFGEGPDTASLKSLANSLSIGDFVSFPGHVDTLPAELNHADVFVVSSHCESFSVVLVEALACGVPVVATNCPVGPPEILKNGQYGTLVAPNDPKALAEGIWLALNGAAIMPPFESWQPYVIENVVAQYEAVFKRVLGL